MKFTLLLLPLLLSCSGEITAQLKTAQVASSANVQLELINDSLDEATWSPCDQLWFLVVDGARELDPTRAYCNLPTALPLGPTALTLTAPSTAGRYFVVLTVQRARASIPLEVGPIDVGP